MHIMGVSDDPLHFTSQLSQAKSGDFFVIQSQKNYLLLLVEEKESDILIFQEISFPKAILEQVNHKWHQWIKEGAPCHTNWYRYALDLNNRQLIYIDSVTQNAVFAQDQKKSFFQSFLSLILEPIPNNDRKKSGLPPPPGAGDRRKFWNPPITYQGKALNDSNTQPYFANWPKDGSILSGKRVELYFPTSKNFSLSYFPFWIEVRKAAGQGKIRVVDSGKIVL